MRTPRILLLSHAGLAFCLFAAVMFAQTRPTYADPRQGTSQVSPERSSGPEPLDINAATAAELKALPGMGAAYARRIIESRPYSAKNQLVTRGVLPQPVYDGIRDRIIAHRVQAPH